MQAEPLPLTRDVVLIGGGHAHALVLRRWGMDPAPGVRLTLINPGPVAPYTGMLPGLVAGHYAREDLMIDLAPLARHAGARLVLGQVDGIDRAGARVHVAGRGWLRYDVASLDVGITSDLPRLPGFAAHGIAAKPLGAFAARWAAFVASLPVAPRVVVIGAGVGGVELALAAAHRLRGLAAGACVTLLDRAPAPLPGVGAAARAALLMALQRAGVAVFAGVEVARVKPQAVDLADGRCIESDFTLGAAGAQPQGWLAETGLDLVQGFVAVGPTLQSSDPAIFAVGDCAAMTHAPRPKAGVYAVRQAPVLAHNLRAALTGAALRRYHPQAGYLKLVSLGGKAALADRFGLAPQGAALWRWKDRIDHAFMRRLTDLPGMTPVAAAGGDPPLCGGCGAKVGAAALTEALAGLPPPQRADVLTGRGDDAAVLRVGGAVQVITTDHLRAFTDDPFLMARITAVHALGDVLAMGAAPQAALAQVTLPRLSPALQAATLAEIMQAAGAVFAAAGADVVGGHTTMGAELTIGFTVTGLVAGRVIGKGGAAPGDALILTKAIGTGTVLAAAMAGARLPGPLLMGEALAATLAAMARPQSAAAAILAPVAHAMTDVTGFGLAGHLIEMLDASGCGAVLHLPEVPLLPGAAGLAAVGHASSLAPANRTAAARMTLAESPAAALLFDPQTAGGLLAAVPSGDAPHLLAALLAAGEAAAIVGQVTAGPVHITVTG